MPARRLYKFANDGSAHRCRSRQSCSKSSDKVNVRASSLVVHWARSGQTEQSLALNLIRILVLVVYQQRLWWPAGQVAMRRCR